MKWNKYTLTTTAEAEDMISSMMMAESPMENAMGTPMNISPISRKNITAPIITGSPPFLYVPH